MKVSTAKSLLSLLWMSFMSFSVFIEAIVDAQTNNNNDVDDADTTDTETETDTTLPDPNACDQLDPASLVFSYIRARDPNEVVFFALEDIPPNLILYLTDNAWTGTGFAANEGTLELVVPEEGISQSTNFGYGPNARLGNTWVPVEGAFSLGREQIILYCIGSTQIMPITAISWNGPFSPPGLENYGMNMSALPPRLNTTDSQTGELEFPGSFLELGIHRNCAVWEYNGIQSAERTRLQQAMGNPNNWKGSECTSESGSVKTKLSIGMMIMSGILGVVLSASSSALL